MFLPPDNKPRLQETNFGVLFSFLDFKRGDRRELSYILHRGAGGVCMPSLYGTPSADVAQVIKDKILSGQSIHFKLVVNDAGTLRLYASYDQIIGSRLIAHVDPKTVPQPQETA